MSAQLVTPERIKALRRKNGWTQAQAAPKLNVSLRTLVSLEKGVQLRPMTLAGIALILQDIEKAEDGGLFFRFGMCKNSLYVIISPVESTSYGTKAVNNPSYFSSGEHNSAGYWLEVSLC